MLVFISWSGQRSKAVAESCEQWFSQVIQAVEPWLSIEIGKGTKWGPEISARLEQSRVGIICLTKENLIEPWLLFEAGALSKTKDAHVCTFLIGLKHSDVKPPLAQFQHTTTEKKEVWRLVCTINDAVHESGERALQESVLKEVFQTYWPRLKESLEKAAHMKISTQGPERSERDMLQELLNLVRSQQARLSQLTDAAMLAGRQARGLLEIPGGESPSPSWSYFDALYQITPSKQRNQILRYFLRHGLQPKPANEVQDKQQSEKTSESNERAKGHKEDKPKKK